LLLPTELQGPVLKFGSAALDEVRGEAPLAGKPIELRLSERRLLAVLMRRSGKLVHKSTLEDALSKIGRELSANTVEVLVSRVRKTLVEQSTGVTIEVLRDMGYRPRLSEEKCLSTARGPHQKPRAFIDLLSLNCAWDFGLASRVHAYTDEIACCQE